MSEYNYVYKTETDGLNASKIISLVAYDIDRDKPLFYKPDEVVGGAELLSLADRTISHTNHHHKWLLNLTGFAPANSIFTMPLFKAKYGPPCGLSAIAGMFYLNRRSFRGGEFWTQEVEDHCLRDVLIIARLYKKLVAEGIIT